MKILLLLCLVLTGCTTASRWGTTASTTAAGGLIAHQVSDGDPLITAAGAGAGLLVGEGINTVNRKNTETAYTKGFDKGRSDAVKQQYWIMVNQQRTDADTEFSLIDLPIPPHQSGGAVLNPTTRTLSVQE